MKDINTAGVFTLLFAVSIAFAAGAARAEAAYSYENDGKTYVATVAAGETATLADGDGPAAVLNENNVTNFVKRGDGTLKVSANLSSFTGDLYVEDGVYSSSPTADNAANTTAGATGTEYKIFVFPGATFDFDTTVAGHVLSREWHICGRGHNNSSQGELGALHVTFSGQALSAVAGKVVLEGETLIRYGSGRDIALVDCPMDMQKNTLILKSDARTLGPIVSCDNYNQPFRSNGGNVIVEGCAKISGHLSWLKSETDGEYSLTVNTNSTLILNSMSTTAEKASAYHALVLKKGAKIELIGGNEKMFRGGVVFEDPVRNVITSNASGDSRYGIHFHCDVKGSGFAAHGKTLVEIRKYDGYSSHQPYNTSTNGMVVADGALVDLKCNERGLLNLSATGGDIIVSNGTVCCGNTFYNFAEWDGAVQFSGSHCTWAGPRYYNYDSPASTAPSGDSRNSMRFKNLRFCGNPSIAFCTNVVVGTLSGVGAVSNTVSVSGSSVYGSWAGDKCGAFKVLTAWNFDVEDVLSGGALATDGRLDFNSGARIRLSGTGKIAKSPYSRVVAYAEGGIYGLASATLEVEEPDRWSLVVGGDGKTLLAVYKPKGMIITFR